MKDAPEPIGVEQARAELGKLVDIAHYQGECTVIQKGVSGDVRAVVVPYEWYRETESQRQRAVDSNTRK